VTTARALRPGAISSGRMNAGHPTGWRPTRVERIGLSLDTSMGTTRVVTDAGPAYLKAMGNRQGPHALASELIASRLARWFGLPTFEWAVIPLTAATPLVLPR